MSTLHEAGDAVFLAENDMIVMWERREKRAFEPETTAFMRPHWKPGAKVVDVGASTGWFAVQAALAGARVVAFEPFAAARARLEENAAMNGVNIEVVSAAASDRAGSAQLLRNPRVALTSGGSIQRPGCRNPVADDVTTVTLDAALPFRDPDLVKIDVEGHELAVLRGARATLANRPPLVLEANTAAECDALAAWLDDFGGYVWRVADERNMLCSPASSAS